MENINDKIRLAELYIKALSTEKSGSYYLNGNQGGLENKDRFVLSHAIRSEVESNLLDLIKSLKVTAE